MIFTLSQLLCAAYLAHWASAQALTAWYTSVGPQVVFQNASSGDLYYSIDTGSGSGAGGFTPWAKLPLTVMPKLGTALSGTGYTDGSGALQGQIFYISNAGSIVEATVSCSVQSGNCILSGVFTISNAVTTGVNNSTGLAATLRTAADGYRVFYHDTAGRTRELRYSAPLNITWDDGLAVNNITLESPTGLTNDGGTNMTIYGISSDGSILSRILSDKGTWLDLPAPQNLTAWDPKNVTIAATSISSPLSKTLFYIGTDRSLHQLNSLNNGITWSTGPQQPAVIWPLADKPNSPFTAAVSGSTTTIFYVSNGDFVQTTLDNGVWQNAVAIFGNSSASATALTGSSATVGPSPTASVSKGGDNAIKIGVGVGIGVGIPAFAAVALLAFLSAKKRRRATEPGPIVPEKDPQEVHSRHIHYELESDLRHEIGDGQRPRKYDNPRLEQNEME